MTTAHASRPITPYRCGTITREAPTPRVRVTRRATTRASALVVVLAFVASLLAACGSGGDDASATVDEYLRAWNRRDYTAMARLVANPPADFADFHRELVE